MLPLGGMVFHNLENRDNHRSLEKTTTIRINLRIFRSRRDYSNLFKCQNKKKIPGVEILKTLKTTPTFRKKNKNSSLNIYVLHRTSYEDISSAVVQYQKVCCARRVVVYANKSHHSFDVYLLLLHNRAFQLQCYKLKRENNIQLITCK